MNKSESLDQLATALCAVQADLKPAIKDASNPFFKSKYADLNSIWDAARELLTKNGLSVAQVNGLGLENTVIIETVLMHKSGQWISGELSLPLSKMDSQGVGSAITYGRRYGLAAILGIVADEDDDGNAASRPRITAVEQPTDREMAGKQLKATIQNLNRTATDKWTASKLNAYIDEHCFPGVTTETADTEQLIAINRQLGGGK